MKFTATIMLRGIAIALCLFLAACGHGPAGFQRPNGVAVAEDGSLYVMDFGNFRIVRLDPEGKVTGAFGRFGTKEGQIYHGWDLALDAQGNLYFCNIVDDQQLTIHDGALVFSPKGKFLREIGGTDYTDDLETSANIPYGLDVDNQGRIYLADYGTASLRIFSPEGQLLGTFFGGDDSLYTLGAMGDVAVDNDRGLLYITDFNYGLLVQFSLKFDSQGKPILSDTHVIGRYGRAPGEFSFPQNVLVDDLTGHVYVGDQGNRRIQVFDDRGGYLQQISLPESEAADWQVFGLALHENRIFAADALNNAIWVFDTDGRLLQKIEGRP